MPSPQYLHLTDREIAALVAWIRTLPRAEGQRRGLKAGPIGDAQMIRCTPI